MSMSYRLLFVAVLCATPALGGCASTSTQGKKAEPSYVVRAWSFQRLREVEGQLAAGDFQGADATLTRMEERKGLNDHEHALMWRQRTHLFASQQQYDQALAALRKCLDLNALPPAETLSARYNLAQLLMANEQWGDAADTLVDWLQKTDEPTTDAVYLAATTLIRADRHAEALPYLERAIAERKDKTPEDWLTLMSSVLIETGDYTRAEVWLKLLLQQHPKKEYWLRLQAVYVALERPERALAVLQLMDKQQMLTEPSELLTLATRYLAAEMPEDAAQLLQRELASGTLKETAENLQLLASALLKSRVKEPAAMVLERAAALSKNGDLFLQSARIRMELEQYKAAAALLQRAFATENLTTQGEAYLLLGIARFREGSVGAARQAFIQAKRQESTKTSAGQWLQHLNALR